MPKIYQPVASSRFLAAEDLGDLEEQLDEDFVEDGDLNDDFEQDSDTDELSEEGLEFEEEEEEF